MDLIELEPWSESFTENQIIKYEKKNEVLPKRLDRQHKSIFRVSSEKALPEKDLSKLSVQCKQWAFPCKKINISSKCFPQRNYHDSTKHLILRNKMIRNIGPSKSITGNTVIIHRYSRSLAFKQSIEKGMEYLNMKKLKKTLTICN